jgi:hypothetical protein
VPPTKVSLAQNLSDKFTKKEPVPYLEKDQWESAYTLLSRVTNEEQIAGKPKIEKYFK